MLSKSEIDGMHDIAENGDPDDLRRTLRVALRALDAERDVVISAMACTGEDGHDGVTDLTVAAEDLLELLQHGDPRWATETIYQNLRRLGWV